jgi:NitT/TauT family transport system permease protein
LFSRVGRVLGARGLTMARLILLPAALPSYLAGLKQGWAFSWRSLMAAEIIVQSPKLGQGLGRLLNQGSELADTGRIMASILLILLVGIVIELGVFGPVERRVLRNRGLVTT